MLVEGFERWEHSETEAIHFSYPYGKSQPTLSYSVRTCQTLTTYFASVELRYSHLEYGSGRLDAEVTLPSFPGDKDIHERASLRSVGL